MSETAIWRFLVAIAAVLLLAGNAAIWVDRSLADRDAFVETAVDELAREEVREEIAGEIVLAIIGNQPLIFQLARGPAELAVTRMLATPAFQPLLNLIAAGLHQMVVTGERPTIMIGAEFLPPLLAAIVAAIGPGLPLAFQPQQIEIELFARQDIPSLERIIDPLQAVGLLCGIAGLVILALSVVVDRNRPRALRRVAFALFAVLAVTLLSIVPLRRLYLSQIEDETARSITADVLGAFTTQLIIQSLLLLVAGAILFALSLWWRGTLTRTPEGQHPPIAPAG